ncbi:hypothetical protein BGP75_19865 [Motiliproteus sp. MSK22-1]|nr:hypothetical protein BGP75_19865 [Motiliproteus sp. MSK22-1]
MTVSIEFSFWVLYVMQNTLYYPGLVIILNNSVSFRDLAVPKDNSVTPVLARSLSDKCYFRFAAVSLSKDHLAWVAAVPIVID